MKLRSAIFHGVAGFGRLDLDDLGKVTSLTGPNGSGKTTILMLLKGVFDAIAQRTVCDRMPEMDPWLRPREAVLVFENAGTCESGLLGGVFGGSSGDLTVHLRFEKKAFAVRSIAWGASAATFEPPQLTRSDLTTRRNNLEKAKANLVQLEANRANQISNRRANDQGFQGRVAEIDRQIAEGRNSIAINEPKIEGVGLVEARLSAGEGPAQMIPFDEIDEFLAELPFPQLHFINAQAFFDDAIPDLIRELLDLKKGRTNAMKRYAAAHKSLERFIQATVEISEQGSTVDMHINGVHYKKASAGTKISVSFFGVTRMGQPNCLFVWDEPENGLHPTRRAMVLNWMFEDERQFIIATHAPEFVPFRNPGGKALRCDAVYFEGSEEPMLNVEHVADRRSAFAVLEVLGVHPARTLFTANVVIWVEGPTELLFYRRWLGARLAARGLLEGFQYTFMQYGGALINYLSVADDALVESTFDLLSTCRHPVVLVDSDLTQAPAEGQPVAPRKAGAQKIREQIDAMNKERPGAGLFQCTTGREVENYLPTKAILHAIGQVWKGFEKAKDQIAGRTFEVGQFDAFDEVLDQYFKDAGVVDDDGKARGRSLWGDSNKVEMMRKALELPGLVESDLGHGCSAQLGAIEAFVVRVAASGK